MHLHPCCCFEFLAPFATTSTPPPVKDKKKSPLRRRKIVAHRSSPLVSSLNVPELWRFIGLQLIIILIIG